MYIPMGRDLDPRVPPEHWRDPAYALDWARRAIVSWHENHGDDHDDVGDAVDSITMMLEFASERVRDSWEAEHDTTLLVGDEKITCSCDQRPGCPGPIDGKRL